MPSPILALLPARARVAWSAVRLNVADVVAAPTTPLRPVHTTRHTAEELRTLSLAAAVERAARASATRGNEAQVTESAWTSVERDTSDSVVLRFPRPEAFTFRPGQYVQVEVDVEGVQHRRPYSLCSGPDEETLEIAVRRVDGGVVSTALVDEAAVGDPVTWTGPLGTFGAGYSAAADPHDPGAIALVVVAGGSGITPILSVLRARLASNPYAPTLLIFANRGYRSVMFRAELAALQAVSPGLTVEHVLERASRRLGGHAGRLDEMRIANLVGGWLAPSAKEVRALLCGPEGLMDVAHAGLRVAGLADDAVERERFAPAAAALDDAVGATWSVSLPGHGVLLQVRDDQTVLEAARAAGVPLRWSCGMGGCGACRLTCVSGAVAHDAPNCLSADELKAGATLTCVARPRSPIELVDD